MPVMSKPCFGEKLRVKLVKSILKRLPMNPQLAIRQGIRFTQNLDYAKVPLKMVVDTPVLALRLNACAKEPHTVKWLETFIRAGDVFYDVGANVGAYSLVAHALTQGDCVIYAFEPSFSTFDALCRNIAENHFQEKITPFQIGVSDITGLQAFHYASLGAGRALHGLGDTRDEGEETVLTPVYSQNILSYRLDDFIPQFGLKKPNLLKIDVDRAIYPVVVGAQQTLQDPGLRTVIIELYDHGEYYEDTLRIMADAGLRLQERFAHASPHLSDHVFVR